MGAERDREEEFPSLGMDSPGRFQETSCCYCLLLLKFTEINPPPPPAFLMGFCFVLFCFTRLDKQAVPQPC